MQRNCKPAINIMIQARDGQPATGSPKIAFRIMINMTMINEKMVRKIPRPEAKDIGVSEKMIIP